MNNSVPKIDRRAPPSNISPGKLFRGLLRTPRPVKKLDVRLDVAPDVVLFAQALTPIEIATVRDADPSEREGYFLALSVVDDFGARVFATPGQTSHLLDHESDALLSAVRDAHHAIAPTYDFSDITRWDAVLQEGAKDFASFSLTIAIGAACEITPFKNPYRPRPDLYFGLPNAELTDGQHLAFLVAFRLRHP